MADKIFCGSGKKFEFNNGGNVHKINLCLSDLPAEHISEFNGKKYIRLTLCKKRNPQEGKPPYYVEVDTWKKPEDVTQPEDGLPF